MAVQEADKGRFDEVKKMASKQWFNNVLIQWKEEANTKNKRRMITEDNHCRVASNFSDWESIMRNMAQIRGLGLLGKGIFVTIVGNE